MELASLITNLHVLPINYYSMVCLLLDIVLTIDYEYAAMNFLPHDIGNHFCEYAGIAT